VASDKMTYEDYKVLEKMIREHGGIAGVLRSIAMLSEDIARNDASKLDSRDIAIMDLYDMIDKYNESGKLPKEFYNKAKEIEPKINKVYDTDSKTWKVIGS
jgi:hypothetical protein